MPVRQSMQQNVHNQNGKRCLLLNAPVGCAKSPPIRERASEISALIVEEGGKIQQLAEVEVAFTADYIDYMAEWARRYEARLFKAIVEENILLFKRALGVTTGILPWNFRSSSLPAKWLPLF